MNTPGPTEKDELQAMRRERRNLIIRNWLNGLFIVLALIAIVGVLYFRAGERGLTLSYGIAILAIIVKMVEAIFRLPGVSTNYSHDERRNHPKRRRGLRTAASAEYQYDALLPGMLPRRCAQAHRRSRGRDGNGRKISGVSPVGCGVFAYNYLDIDFQEAAHGRAAAVASGIKRVLPDHLSSPTKVMVMPQVSAPTRHCTPSIVEKALPLSSSTTRFTV